MDRIKQLDINKYKETPWDFSNSILYDLCRDNFKHDKDKAILAKTLFIGRIYAAAIERRKSNLEIGNDDFYKKKIVGAFKKPKLDETLKDLKQKTGLSKDNICQALKAHQYLVSILSEITALNKRSFCSKYLHFHLPELFFIYDSRATNALSTLKIEIPNDLQDIPTTTEGVDKVYATYFCKCVGLQRKIDEVHKTTITTRQLDNILIDIANDDIRKTKQGQ